MTAEEALRFVIDCFEKHNLNYMIAATHIFIINLGILLKTHYQDWIWHMIASYFA